MNDLMDLIKDCEALTTAKSPNYSALDVAGELGKLGFDKMAKKLGKEFLLAEKMELIHAEKYPVITQAKIQKFLDGLAKDYNLKRKKNTIVLNGHTLTYTVHPGTPTGLLGTTISYNSRYEDYDYASPLTGLLAASTCDAMSSDPGTVGAYKWQEVRISEYEGIPPAPALKALAIAQGKEIFDYFTIASVSAVKDPLLLGRLDGVEDAFFLAQWGDDVSLDDVI